MGGKNVEIVGNQAKDTFNIAGAETKWKQRYSHMPKCMQCSFEVNFLFTFMVK